MTRPQEWHSVLDAEVRRWSAMPWEKLVSALRDLHAYKVEFDSKTYQVEVELLESTEKHFRVMVAVDDGRLPAALSPLTQSFVRETFPPNGAALV